MKNKPAKTKIQHRKVLFLTLFSSLVFFACQKEDAVDCTENQQEIKLVFSVEPEFENDTEYVPMNGATRSLPQTNMVRVHNGYQYFLLQELSNGDYMFIESSDQLLFDPDLDWWEDAKVFSGQTYNCFTVNLRPGKYKIIVFTATNYLEANIFTPGEILPGPSNTTDPVPFTVRYKKFWSNYHVLPYEAFYAQGDFTVSKTTDLHTTPQNTVNMQLERRCSKFRFAFQETTDADHTNNNVPYFGNFFVGNLYASVWTKLRQTNGEQFPWGLDMWGRLWYDPNPNVNDSHKYLDALSCFNKPKRTSPYNHTVYYMTTHENVLIGPIYHFSEPGTAITVTHNIMDVQFEQHGAGAHYDPVTPHEFTLENNKITGIILTATNGTKEIHWPWQSRTLTPVYESDGTTLMNPAKLFEGNYEHDWQE